MITPKRRCLSTQGHSQDFEGSPISFCLPSPSPLPPLSLSSLPTLWGSRLFRFTPLQGIPRGWLTENTSYWTTQTGPQANGNSAHTHTHAQQQTHTGTCSGCTEFASVILWVTERSSGDGRGIWKVEVIIFQGTLRSPAVAAATSSAHLILGTSQGEQTDNQNNTERRGGDLSDRGKLWFNHVIG